MIKLSKKMKIELAFSVVMAIVLSTVAAYVSQRTQDSSFQINGVRPQSSDAYTFQNAYSTQQIVRENIQGELDRGFFEIVVEGLWNLTFHYGGRVPRLEMYFDDEYWRGYLNCKIPTDNVTSYTFDVRHLINEHGKVTHISITVTEIETNQTGNQNVSLSDVSISLKEVAEGGPSPIISQLGTVASWLITGLVWIAQGLIIGVPLCFVSLGIVVMVERGIVPLWRRQFRGKNVNKAET